MDAEGQLSHFPLFADLRGRAVLVAGGGEIAARKVALLRRAGAAVTLVAPQLSHGLDELAARGAVTWLAQRFEPAQLDGHWLAVAATDDRAVNAAVATAARALRMPVNVVDDPAQSTVIVPAIIDRSPLVIAISTGGAAPVLARRLRAEIETLVDASWASLASLCARWRERIREQLPDVVVRRRFYEGLVDGPVRRLLAAGHSAAAERQLGEALGAGRASRRGSVSLVGAGPGDPGLLTLNAVRALQQADVILHDQLVTDEILDLARRDADRIAVGKRAGGHQTAQVEINALMVEHARAGRRVVRLKGGDPFVFGRGGEELEYLRAHGVDYDVVPGITAALACAAYAGIPLTHREHAQSVRMVTAHCRDSLDTLDWHCLARERQTLVVYMGVGNAGAIQRELLAHGRDPLTPVAVIENGTRRTQRVLAARLETLAATVTDQAVRSPALLIIGEVAGLAGALAWFGDGAAVPARGMDVEDAAPARNAA